MYSNIFFACNLSVCVCNSEHQRLRSHFVIVVLVGRIKLINCTSTCNRKWTQQFIDQTAAGRLSTPQLNIASSTHMRRRVFSSVSLASLHISFLRLSYRAFSYLCSCFLFSWFHLRVAKRSRSTSPFYSHSPFSSWLSATACHSRPTLSRLSVRL